MKEIEADHSMHSIELGRHCGSGFTITLALRILGLVRDIFQKLPGLLSYKLVSDSLRAGGGEAGKKGQ